MTANTLLPAFVIAILVVLSWSDLRLRIIPNRIVLPAWALVLALELCCGRAIGSNGLLRAPPRRACSCCLQWCTPPALEWAT